MKRSLRRFRMLAMFFVALAVFIGLGTASAYAQTVDIVLTGAPATQPAVDDNVVITVQIQPVSAQQLSTVELYLNYDPAILEVLSVAVPLNTPLGLPLAGPAVDSNLGHIDYQAGTLGTPPSTQFDLLVITFRVKVATPTTLSFSTADPRITDVFLGQNTVLGTATDILIPSDPTVAITLGYFLAQPAADGNVNFLWQTATETGTAGFNVLAVTQDGNVQLNDQLIASPVIDSVEPTNYTFRATTEATSFYLEEMEIKGSFNEHGPFDQGVEYGVYALPANVELTPRIWLPLLER